MPEQESPENDPPRWGELMRPGWGAVLEGDPADLVQLADYLKEPFSVWIEIYEGQTVFRSDSLDKLTSADEVYERAPDLIARLNALIALVHLIRRPIRFAEQVVYFAQDGTVHKSMRIGPGELTLEGNSAVRISDELITVMGPDGKPRPAPPPQPREIQYWAKVVGREPLIHDALLQFGKGANWFPMYKAWEFLCHRFGGEHAFRRLNWEPESEIRRFTETASWERKVERHAKPSGEPPKNPMRPNVAYALLGRLIQRALTELRLPPDKN